MMATDETTREFSDQARELGEKIVGLTLKSNGSGMAHYDESLDLEHLDVPPRTMLVD